MIAVLLAAALVLPAPNVTIIGASKLYTQAEPGARLAGLQIVVSAGTARQSPSQGGLAALAAETIVQTPIDGRSLFDRSAAAGGSIAYAIAPDRVRFTIEALPDALPGIARDLARAMRAPDTSAATLAAARRNLGDRIADDERNPVAVGLDMLRGSYFSGGAAQPLFGTRVALANAAPADVAAFVAAHYRRGNAFATAIGNVDTGSEAAARAILDALPDGAESSAALTARPFAALNKRIVTHRDVGTPFVLLGFAAPALGERDFAAMLVVRTILGEVAERRGATTPAAFERGVDVLYAYDLKPATLTLAINGNQLDPSAGLTVVQTILRAASTRPFAPSVLARYKATARGQWQLEATSFADRAWLIGAAVAHGADPAEAQATVAAIDRVTAADVLRMAKTYLQHYTIALVLPRSRANS